MLVQSSALLLLHAYWRLSSTTIISSHVIYTSYLTEIIVTIPRAGAESEEHIKHAHRSTACDVAPLYVAAGSPVNPSSDGISLSNVHAQAKQQK
eukprot:1192770-Pyramimonas_sp.AAC.2